MSQIVTSSINPDTSIKFAKNVNAFTEHGILMLSSVLNSERAVAVNIQIMRTFTKLRRMFIGYKELKEKIDQMPACRQAGRRSMTVNSARYLTPSTS